MTRYRIQTYDPELEQFTPQEGMSQPWDQLTIAGLRRAMHELRGFGYQCNRSDPAVLIEAIEPNEQNEFDHSRH